MMPPPRWGDRIRVGIIGGIAVAAGFLNAWRLRWICDDAFITFRYIDNWIGGLGLVYNAGERVEGYTHFLWLCAVGALRRLGADPVSASEGLGILAATGTIAIFALISHRLFCRDAGAPRPRAVIPFTALALALNYEFAVWGSSGLETAAFTFLLAVAFYMIAIRPAAGIAGLALAAIPLILAAMTRPDGLIFYAAAIPFVAVRTRSARRVAAFLFPLGMIYLPYLAWKVAYYGDIFPNTYYAKSGDTAWWGQGLAYIWLFARGYWSSFLFAAAIPWMAVRIGRKGRRVTEDAADGALLLATGWTLAYLILFVARVGGDFMYARFVIPTLPFMYFAIETMLRRAIGGRRRILIASLAALPIVFSIQGKLSRDSIYRDAAGRERSRFGPWGVTDERWYYTHDMGAGRNLIQGHREIGEALAVYFAGTNVKVVEGGQASLAYYGRFKTCIDRYGLTDAYVAHLPIEKRSRPGHEKIAPVDYLIGRGVQFEFLRPPFRNDPYRLIYFRVGEQVVRGCLFTYDREIMRHLRERFPEEVKSVDFEAYLDAWLRRLPSMPLEEARREYEGFREFYFAWNRDPERERPIRSRLGME